MSLTLTHYENQLVLYIKGHFEEYKRVTMVGIVSKAYDLHLERTNEYSVYHMLMEVYIKLIEAGLISHNLDTFIAESFKKNHERTEDGQIIERIDIMNKIIADIQNMPVYKNDVKVIDFGGIDMDMVNEYEYFH
ncbi:hypothetical protein [Rossellomorea marisflavi]|uniref:hypothetical protein n=1 Tax=Rossellomorea marisflavi TaxID=189381 RepID=UPI003FA19522